MGVPPPFPFGQKKGVLIKYSRSAPYFMAFSRLHSAQTNLLKGQIITVETDVSGRSLHAFSIVGLPDKAVEEARDRVGSAIKNTGHKSPKQKNQKIVVSLAPAEVRKEGSFFDLAIALGYLLSENFIKFDPKDKLFVGELSLNGELRGIRGALPIVAEAKREGFKEIYLPKQNVREAALVGEIKIFGAKNLREVIDHIAEKEWIETAMDERIEIPKENMGKVLSPAPKTKISYKPPAEEIDFSDIRGQESVKRGLLIAAAGRHNILMTGPPGTGKTLLARAFRGILPRLSEDEVLEITGIHSVAATLDEPVLTSAPFRSPHHTSSYVSLIGGGAKIKPGEVTLAHRGVLFLDEFPEFDKRVLESLRQPLEDNMINISRAKGTARFPANFILIAAMNPCACGNFGSGQKECVCKPADLSRYSRKISGPIMDRIDLWVEVPAVDYQKLSGKREGESSADLRAKIEEARRIQRERFLKLGRKIYSNSEMNVKDINSFLEKNPKIKDFINESAQKLRLSARAYHRVLKLARTIADLGGKENVTEDHLLEALQYRPR